MHTIRSKERLAENIYRIWVDAPRIAKKAKAGQFAILRVNEEGERIPLTIADAKPEEAMVALIYQVVGYSTRLLEQLEVGDALSDLTGPLGHPSKLEGVRRALCVGGGVGTAVVYPTAKALHAQGSRVDATGIWSSWKRSCRTSRNTSTSRPTTEATAKRALSPTLSRPCLRPGKAMTKSSPLARPS